MSVTVLPLPRRRLVSVRHLATALGGLIVGAVLLVAIAAPSIAPHDPFAQDLNLRLMPPMWMDGGSTV
ncbi:MAG TPA: ABC transporter permease, partial [Ktedonobacterales bacterium]|nr:ABC transporter permease [Ktedonobacterales bacterium]